MNIPVIKPTESERLIWNRIHPRKTGGLIRQGTAGQPYDLPDCYYGPRDKNNPDHWDCKMKGGPDSEWWVYMMEGASRVLDIGCGFGFPSFYLAQNGFEVVGIDPSPREIATAERYREKEGPSLKLTYMVTDQDILPFEDNSFDGAVFSGSVATAGDPAGLVREVIRVLRPGSKVAFDEEDRALEPKTHPVAEKMMIIKLNHDYYLWVESRISDPYLSRRYMIRLQDIQIDTQFVPQKAAGAVLPSVGLEDTELQFGQILEHAVSGEYGEALGYDAYTLTSFVEKMGFTNLQYWARPNGKRFAEELQAAGILSQMPDNISAVLRALVRSIPPLTTPTTLISCISPLY